MNRSLLASKTRRFALLSFATVATVAALFAPDLRAAPADRDPTFGSAGLKSLLNSDYNDLKISDIAVQADGKVLLYGVHTPDSTGLATVWRLNADGTLDPTFGSGGVLTFEGPGKPHEGKIAVQSDGRILVAARYGPGNGSSFFVARITSTGVLDSGFSTDGWATQACPSTSGAAWVRTLLRDGGGKVLVLVQCKVSSSDWNQNVYRFDSSGALMISWGTEAGYTPTGPDGPDTTSGSMVADGLGGLIVVGKREAAGGTGLGYISRIMIADGTFDSTYANVGSYHSIPGADGEGWFNIFAELLPSGSVALMGSAQNQNFWAATRYGESGSVESGFETTQKVDLVSPEVTATVAKLSDTTLLDDVGTIMAGEDDHGSGVDSTLFVRDFSAQPLTSFGDAGKLVDPVAGTSDSFTAIDTDAQKRIVALRVINRPDPDGGGPLDNYRDYDVIRYLGPEWTPPDGGGPGDGGTSGATSPAVPSTGGPTAALKVRITTPSKSRVKRRKARRFAGIASGSGLASVRIAITRVDKRLLKRHRRCQWMTSTRAKFKSYRTRSRSCSKPARWLRARGTDRWSLSLKRSLRPGRYSVHVRALGASGDVSTITRKRLTIVR